MTREEKNKLAQIVSFELCPNRRYCITNYGEKANCYSDNNFAECSTIMKVADNLINHETNLLKEFVEWYKQMLIKDHDDKAWMMNHTEQQEVEDRYYYRGQCNAIQRLITLLDSDLKTFLEDKNEL